MLSAFRYSGAPAWATLVPAAVRGTLIEGLETVVWERNLYQGPGQVSR